MKIEATPAWKDKFVAKHNLKPVSPETALSFRTNNHDDDAPNWFAPDPVGRYDVWDQAGHFGSVWMDKSNGHIFFYEWQL